MGFTEAIPAVPAEIISGYLIHRPNQTYTFSQRSTKSATGERLIAAEWFQTRLNIQISGRLSLQINCLLFKLLNGALNTTDCGSCTIYKGNRFYQTGYHKPGRYPCTHVSCSYDRRAVFAICNKTIYITALKFWYTLVYRPYIVLLVPPAT
jgi:hypothetical protein